MSAAGCVTGRSADGAGRTGDAEAELVGEVCEETLEQRALADARGPGDDERAGEGGHKLCTRSVAAVEDVEDRGGSGPGRPGSVSRERERPRQR